MNSKQREAAETFGKDIVVNAGAGSGKTTVLVERFVRAVTELGDAPDRILAVTFTDLAANHMKQKLIERFAGLKREEDRRALETAYIGTIHSFCTRLLRENPIEAAVDPYFKVLSKPEADILTTRAMDAAFEAQINRPLWLDFLVDRDEKRLRAAMTRLYAHFRAIGEDDRLLAIKEGSGRRSIEAKIKRLLDEIAPILRKKEKRGKNETAALEASARIPEIFPSKKIDWLLFERVRQIESSIKKQGSDDFKEWVDDLRECLELWKTAALQDLYAPLKHEFLRVFTLFRENYEKEKKAAAALDFDDLTILACRLLESEVPHKKAVRARYRERFRHIFVDEFQDTSPLQARLIDLLRTKGNLFVVGDRQQSIYSFRHADPSLFARYEAAAGQKIALDENYRSRPAVLDFVNGFFEKESGDVFGKLLAGKKFNLSAGGSAEIIPVFYGKEEAQKNLEEAREEEARLLAGRLDCLVQEGSKIEGDTSCGRPLQWGDIAVLLRSSTQMPVYERAFSRAGIPFYSPRSGSFFEKPEIKDLLSFLTLLDHPDDDVSLAAALRSPLGAVSDDGLFWLARAAKKEDPRRETLSRAFKILDKVEGLSAEDKSRAGRFFEFLESLRKAKNSFTVSTLLEKALSWSHYESVVIAGPGGIQRIANVRKLVEMVRSLEEKGPLDATEFVRYARGMAERDDTEEARTQTQGSNAVFLSSIHGAKGLEFPCVAIANLGGRKSSKERMFVASVEGGLGFAMPDPADEKEKLPDEAYRSAAADLKEKETAEESRVLYVAMTRAQEHLLLCGSVEKTAAPSKSSSWMSRILSHHGQEVPSPQIMPVAPLSEPVPVLAPKDVKKIIEGLELPEKPYDLAQDLTVSDLLRHESVEEEPDRPSMSLNDDESLPRNEFGTLFHKLMELSLMRVRGGRSISADTFASLLQPLSEKEREEAVSGMMRFWKSPLGAEIRKAPKCYPELPFIYKTPHGLLKGQIDLVYQAPGGGWCILDYKTNRIAPGQIRQAAVEYEFQLGLYAFVFKELYGVAPSKGVLYFMSIPQTHEFEYSGPVLEEVRGRLSEAWAK